MSIIGIYFVWVGMSDLSLATQNKMKDNRYQQVYIFL